MAALLKLGGFTTSAYSFAHDSWVLLNTRSLASPSILGHFGSSLWICPNMGSCTAYHTLVFDFALDIRAFCILVSGIPHKSSLLGDGFSLDILVPAPSYLASPTNRVMHRLSDTRLSISTSIHGCQWHIREGDSAMPPLVRKKSVMVTRKRGKHGLAHFSVKALVARDEKAPPRCHPLLKSQLYGSTTVVMAIYGLH